GDRTAAVLRFPAQRPPDWDWDWVEDGNLALDRHEIPAQSQEDPKVRLSQSRVPHRLSEQSGSVTVPRMPAQSRRAPAARKRPRGQSVPHRARRLIVLTVVCGVLLGTLLI